MSHNITLKGVNFTDMGLLGTIVTQLSGGKASLDMTATSFRTYHGQPTGCDARINMLGPHDVGFKKNKDGGFTPVFDPYSMDSTFQGQGGNKIGLLQQEYGLQQAEYEAAQNNYSSERVVNASTGTITLELTENS
jgi:hypothetical protein